MRLDCTFLQHFGNIGWRDMHVKSVGAGSSADDFEPSVQIICIIVSNGLVIFHGGN